MNHKIATLMESRFNTLVETSKRAVRCWWLPLLAGILLFVLGLAVLLFPQWSYHGMALLFGWVILAVGILNVVLSASNRHFVTRKGWMLAGGIIEMVLGIILICHTELSAATLPVFLGFWLLLRGFASIGLSDDMRTLDIPGSNWSLAAGILLLLSSFCILFQPILFGSVAVVIWIGVSLLFAAAGAVSFALQLRKAHCCRF